MPVNGVVLADDVGQESQQRTEVTHAFDWQSTGCSELRNDRWDQELSVIKPLECVLPVVEQRLSWGCAVWLCSLGERPDAGDYL